MNIFSLVSYRHLKLHFQLYSLTLVLPASLPTHTPHATNDFFDPLMAQTLLDSKSISTETIPATVASSITRYIADTAANPAEINERDRMGLESVTCINPQRIDDFLFSFFPSPSLYSPHFQIRPLLLQKAFPDYTSTPPWFAKS